MTIWLNKQDMKVTLNGNEFTVWLRLSDASLLRNVANSMAERTVCEMVDEAYFHQQRVTEPQYVYEEKHEQFLLLVTEKTGLSLNKTGFHLSFQVWVEMD